MTEETEKKEEVQNNTPKDSAEEQNKDKKNLNPLGKIPKKPKMGFNIYWIYGLIAVFFLGIQYFNFSGETKEITWPCRR